MTHAEAAARAALQLLRTHAGTRTAYARWLQERVRIARLLADVAPDAEGEIAEALRAAHLLLSFESRNWIEALQWAREHDRVKAMLADALETARLDF